MLRKWRWRRHVPRRTTSSGQSRAGSPTADLKDARALLDALAGSETFSRLGLSIESARVGAIADISKQAHFGGSPP